MNILEIEPAHQRAKYLKYKEINKAFAKNKNPKEETVILDDTSNSESYAYHLRATDGMHKSI